MARETSIEVYHQIKDEGLLTKRRWQIYEVVFKHGPMTSGEAYQIMNQGQPTKALTSSRSRFTELRDAGVFTEMGTRRCKVTGRTVIVWDVTKKLPIKLEKTKPQDCPWCKGTGIYHQ